MIIECEISLGELVDKLSILRIKLQKIEDSAKLVNVKKEEMALAAKLNELQLDNIDYHIQEMLEVNLLLWKIEDDIRDLERAQKFDGPFIELARQVYITNDERFRRKNVINSVYKSDFTEVKSYQKY